MKFPVGKNIGRVGFGLYDNETNSLCRRQFLFYYQNDVGINVVEMDLETE